MDYALNLQILKTFLYLIMAKTNILLSLSKTSEKYLRYNRQRVRRLLKNVLECLLFSVTLTLNVLI